MMGFAAARAEVSGRAMVAPRMPAPRRRADGIVTEALVGPVDLDLALTMLGDQPALGVPAKLALVPAGHAVLWAEVPESEAGAGGEDPLLDAALGTAWRWLHGLAPVPAGNGDARGEGKLATARSDRADARRRGAGQPSQPLENALGVLSWPWRFEDGVYRVRTGGRAAALRMEGRGAGWLRVSREELPMRVPTRQAARAVALFALEASARLRLARVAVRAEREVVRAGWDAVVGTGGGLASWLGEAVEALDVAHEETARSLRALAQAEVAAAYLRMREPSGRWGEGREQPPAGHAGRKNDP
jgi:hypothetical protein